MIPSIPVSISYDAFRFWPVLAITGRLVELERLTDLSGTLVTGRSCPGGLCFSSLFWIPVQLRVYHEPGRSRSPELWLPLDPPWSVVPMTPYLRDRGPDRFAGLTNFSWAGPHTENLGTGRRRDGPRRRWLTFGRNEAATMAVKRLRGSDYSVAWPLRTTVPGQSTGLTWRPERDLHRGEVVRVDGARHGKGPATATGYLERASRRHLLAVSAYVPALIPLAVSEALEVSHAQGDVPAA